MPADPPLPHSTPGGQNQTFAFTRDTGQNLQSGWEAKLTVTLVLGNANVSNWFFRSTKSEIL